MSFVAIIGIATIGYVITDGIGGMNSSLITVLVTNVPPLANPDTDAVTDDYGYDGLREVLHEVRRADRHQLRVGRAEGILEIVEAFDGTCTTR